MGEKKGDSADALELDVKRIERLVDDEPKWGGKVYAAAKYYISLGWPVIPIAYGQKQLPGRDAIRKRGLKKQLSYDDASISPARIDHWFHPSEGIWRGMNIGIVCGDSVSAADLDEKEGISGAKEYGAHVGFDQGRTPIQATPSGGTHILFKHVKGFTTRTNVLNGVDTRGETRRGKAGSHIVAYPSVVDVQEPGKIVKVPYIWKQGGIPVEAPEKLLEIISKVVEFKAKPAGTGGGRGNENVTDEDYFPDATLEDIQDALQHCDPTDYDTWVYVGMSIHSEYDGADGFDIWHEWSKDVKSYKSEADCWNHWGSFNRDPDGIKIATLFGIARKGGYRKPGELSPELIEELRYNDKGGLSNVNHNLWIILQSKELQEEFGGRLKYDRFKGEVLTKPKEPIVNEGFVQLARWISTKFQFERGKDTVRDYARMIAMDNSIDVLQEYMSNIVWDKTKRLEKLAKVLYAKNDYQESAVRRWLIGGVARAMQPGCSATHMLILFGGQGKGKSRFFEALTPDPEWFTDSPTFKFGRDLAARDEEIKLQGRWIVEVPELAGIWKSDFNDLKNFLTLQAPVIRRPYDPDPTPLPRRCIFGGTTNMDEVINDPTGSRRFAFLSIGENKIDVEWVRENRDQIWAEAKHLFDAGEQWWFNDNEFNEQVKENRSFNRDNPWTEMVLEWVQDKSWFTYDDIYDHVLSIPISQRTTTSTTTIKNILAPAGWRKTSSKLKNGKRLQAWRNPNKDIDLQFAGHRWTKDSSTTDDGEY